MATNSGMPKGLTVSIKFTPQAQDDTLTFLEDSGGTGYNTDADLLANDLASGAARIVGVFGQSETYVQANIASLLSSSIADVTVGGATVHLDPTTGDVNITFDSANYNDLSAGEIEYLGTFTYVIRMANGAFSTAIASVKIIGENDGVTIVAADDTGSVTEDTPDDTAVSLTDTGTISFADPDLSDTHNVSVVPAAGNAYGGTLTASATDAGDGTGTVAWNYAVDNSATQHLGAGVTDTETFTVTIDDGNGGTVNQDVTVTITGVNDAASITDNGTADTYVTEAGGTANGIAGDAFASGDLNVVDVDDGESSFQAASVADLAGTYGNFTFDETTGNWTYSLNDDDDDTQALAAGAPATDTLTISSADGTTHDITVDITGANDAPVAADAVAAVAEDATTNGSVSATDVDTGASITYSTASTAAGLAFNSDGTWTFDAASYDSIGVGEFQDVVVNYTATDENGATDNATLTITVSGVNDAPEIVAVPGDSSGQQLTETNGGLTASGTLTAQDADLTDSVTATVVGVTHIGSTGGLTDTQLLDYFSVPTDVLVDGTQTSAQFTWSFDSGTEAFNYLAEGEVLKIHYTIRPDDGHSPPPIGDGVATFTITGTNDLASITANGVQDLAVTEDDATNNTAGGALSISDADAGQAAFLNPVGLAGMYGNFTFNVLDGTWGYTLTNANPDTQALGEGVTDTDTLTVWSVDGSAHYDITVTITGAAEIIPSVIPSQPTAFTGTGDPNDVPTVPAGTVTVVTAGSTLNAGTGNNIVVGTSSNDTIHLQAGNDWAFGGAGTDSIDGNNDNDIIYGGTGNDDIAGNNQMDSLYGGSGSDSISGGNDNDLIVGGYGADNLTGNTGTDTFQFLSLLDTNDVISGFLSDASTADPLDNVAGSDILDFGDIDTDSVTTGDQAFASVTNATSFSVGDSIIWYAADTDATAGVDSVIVLADTDGNLATAEFMVTLSGITAIAASDFML